MKVGLDRFLCICIDRIPVSISIMDSPVQLATHSLVGRSVSADVGLGRRDVLCMLRAVVDISGRRKDGMGKVHTGRFGATANVFTVSKLSTHTLSHRSKILRPMGRPYGRRPRLRLSESRRGAHLNLRADIDRHRQPVGRVHPRVDWVREHCDDEWEPPASSSEQWHGYDTYQNHKLECGSRGSDINIVVCCYLPNASMQGPSSIGGSIVAKVPDRLRTLVRCAMVQYSPCAMLTGLLFSIMSHSIEYSS
jgi:hypothetical protein